MPGRQGQVDARLGEILGRVPTGRVVGIATLARHLGVPVPQAQAMAHALGEAEGDPAPWHRVVADGGAIGRHKRRDRQIALLRAEGLTVSPAGIVQDFHGRAVADLDAPGAGAVSEPRAQSDGREQAPSRARGRRDAPSSTVGRK